MIVDICVLSLAYWLAFAVRFDWDLPHQMLKRLLFTWPYVVAFQYSVLLFFSVPRLAWRFISIREARIIFVAATTFTVILGVLRIAAASVVEQFGIALYLIVPFGVVATDYILAFVGITGVRVLRRALAESAERGSRGRGLAVKEQIPTLMVGAGSAGANVAKELKANPQLGIRIVGFVDDNAEKRGTIVGGHKVVGSSAKLAQHIHMLEATQVLIAIANVKGDYVRRIKAICDEADVTLKIIPGLSEIVGGQIQLSRIRDVAISDLLGRDPVQLDEESISAHIHGKTILVTGAGGSIGSDICRQVMRFEPRRLVLLERFENALFEIHRELLGIYPSAELLPRIADITDTKRIRRILEDLRPDTIYHAAAHKHVPMMEMNPTEAIKNNIFGTRTIADLARATGVGHFVMISTDKAVNPKSIMGASKRVAELYIQGLASTSTTTTFVAVRFGNVLGSCGSVVPIFKQQIAQGGPVTVTDPEMRRYFMTIPEATQLVLQAGTMGRGGEVFILDMGTPVRIERLARDLIELSGLRPDQDIQIAYTGIRPGEKLFEELATDEENAAKTRHSKIFIGKVRSTDHGPLVARLDQLRATLDDMDVEAVEQFFKEIVPEFDHPD